MKPMALSASYHFEVNDKNINADQTTTAYLLTMVLQKFASFHIVQHPVVKLLIWVKCVKM